MALPLVGVLGSGTAMAGERVYQDAVEVGRRLASAGVGVVCGGRGGVMEAVARGVAEIGGTTVGLLPGGNGAGANEFVSLAIPTGLGQLRNSVIVHSSPALIAIGGGWGTLNEVSLACKLGRSPVWVHGLQVTNAEGLTPAGLVYADDPGVAVEIALNQLSGF